MDGVHDMGGMDGFGKVEPEVNEPVYHAAWEGRVNALQRAMGFAGGWLIDHSRYAVERIPPGQYLTASYYERWRLAIERNCVEQGLVGADEFDAGHVLRPGKPLPRKLSAEIVNRGLKRGGFARPASEPALFAVGDQVRAKNIHPATHTRLPRYVRGHVGVIEKIHGVHVFPDSVTIGRGENPQWLYVVCFDGRELWGEESDPRLKVSIDAFEPYLEKA